MQESSAETPHDGYASLAPSQALGSRTQTKRRNRKKAPPTSTGTNCNSNDQQQPQPPQPPQATKKKPSNPTQNNQRKGGNNRGRGGEVAAQVGRKPSTATDDPSSSSADVAAVLGATKKGTRRRGRTNSNKKEHAAANAEVPAENLKQQQQNQQQTKNPTNSKKKNRKRYPWRKFVPSGTVDPITLESLLSLEYPPFALMANAPYDPVPVWPVMPDENQNEASGQKRQPTVDIEELNRQRIAEQWGNKFAVSDAGTARDNKTCPEQQRDTDASLDLSTKRHYNLYDGRALAYYIVSQLQFIDPLNRRDLTRPELLNLDVYLRRHGFQDLNVTDAYDAKGVTISSAGAAATTAQGRADILQQTARNLLNSLFGGQSVSAAPRPAQTFVQEQYAALQLQEQQDQSRQRGRNGAGQHHQAEAMLNPNAVPFDSGFYASQDGGLMVIDDDENVGMRGGGYGASRGSNNQAINPFYSASHIAARHGSGLLSATTADAFPELPTPAAANSSQMTGSAASTTSRGAQSTRKPAPKPSKTLSRIVGSVKKTTPEEQQKQWRAREEALKRAMMANMSSGVSTLAIGSASQQSTPPGLSMATTPADVSEEKLQRNKAFAEALGVTPATLRQSNHSGWTRPTTVANITIDEFGNELDAVIYPDSLLSQARDRMALVLKMEKKWKAFLEDDKAASLPLNPMDRSTRIFVHHYSDFWNLKTESFDPEPRRYIHCVKLVETHMPRPLLSDATRMWRGPTTAVNVSLDELPRGPTSRVADSQQTAGEFSKSREIPPPPDRVPLPLMPRTLTPGQQKSETNAQVNEDGGEEFAASRFVSLLAERERPKITLAKRTVPLELPPFQPPTTEITSAAEIQLRRARVAEKERRQKEAEERKRLAMEAVFASDDEGGDHGDDGKAVDTASTWSDWDEPEPVYRGSDSEE